MEMEDERRTSCWEECHDENKFDYYNVVSGESVWEIDEGREEEEEVQEDDKDDEWIGYDGYYTYVVEDNLMTSFLSWN